MKNKDTQYITIKQASLETNKHPDTIRNLIRKYRQTDNVTTDKKGRVLISVELLNNTYKMTSPEPPQEVETEKTASNSSYNEPKPDKATQTTLEALIKQLETKDKLINDLTTLLNEKEKNTLQLMDQSQRLLAGSIKPPANDIYDSIVEKPKTTQPKTTKRVNKQPSKPLKARKKPVKAKKHWWSRKTK